MKVGELKVFPKIREALSQPPLNPPANTEVLSKTPGADMGDVPVRAVRVVSSGAACRMQIRQGTGVEAIHPIVLVADFLKNKSK
jgi:hypothetical protein